MKVRLFSIIITLVMCSCDFWHKHDIDYYCSNAKLTEAEIAIIQPESDQKITVKFDPRSFRINRKNIYSESLIPGIGHKILQFVGGETTIISVYLCFDSFDRQVDVREETREVAELMEINEISHAPPVLNFKWGEFSFECVLEEIVEEYSAFFPDGTPAKAKLNVIFKEFKRIEPD